MPFRLVFAHLKAHPLRTFLTFGSVTVAVLLLCFLRSAVAGLGATVQAASGERLWVQSAVSLFVDLPLAYETKIESVPGVARVCKWQWFGGQYRDGEGFFAQFAVDPETFLESYPEMEIAEGSYDAFASERTACLLGEDLAEKYGWGLGDRIPLLGTIFPKPDGSAWEFTVRGIYRSTKPTLDEQTMFFHYDYLRETLESESAMGPIGVGVYLLAVEPGADPTAVMSEVDALFENGPQRVQTTTEAEFTRQFVSMLGNVPALLSSIGGAVLFAIFFAVLNTMLMAARERERDVGVLKALGFTDGSVFAILVLESVLLCGAAGLAGAGLAELAEPAAVAALAGQLPGFTIDATTLVLGVGLALAVGLLAGAGPALRASRLQPVEALRAEG